MYLHPLDNQATVLCQAVHTAVGGRPIRWVDLHRIRLQLGGSLADVETAARHAAGRDWLVPNAGRILHSVCLGPALLELVRREHAPATSVTSSCPIPSPTPAPCRNSTPTDRRACTRA